ncbi:MAG: MurR/RpiR family transcriptional regulator [Mycoplasmataceae bacterium]|nr:MurR/RpiR family transcriptional regulator [Mycoplasmataceae bacterium]
MKINEIIKTEEHFSDLEKEIIQEINTNPNNFLLLNIVDYSKILFTSKSSISRLSQKLGFANLMEMKLFVKEQLTKNEFSYNINPDSLLKDRISNLKSYNNFAINETLTNLDLDNLQKICIKIYNSKKIITFGVGSSFLAALELANNLQKIGLNIAASNDIHNSILKISNFNEEDLLICFSKTGITKEVIFLNKAAKHVNSKTLLITAQNDEVENIDFKIHLMDLKKDNRIVATSSKISQIVVADAIFLEIYSLLKNNVNKEHELLKMWEKF